MRSVLVSVALLGAIPPLHAQYLLPSPSVALRQPGPTGEVPVGRPIAAGIGLGLAGFLVGGLTGLAVSNNCGGSEWCAVEGAFLGAAAGGTMGMALGVHLGNRRQGSFPLDFLTGAAVWGTGIVIASSSRYGGGATAAMFVAIPIAQLVTTVAVERAVGRSRARSAVAVLPSHDGGLALVASVPF